MIPNIRTLVNNIFCSDLYCSIKNYADLNVRITIKQKIYLKKKTAE